MQFSGERSSAADTAAGQGDVKPGAQFTERQTSKVSAQPKKGGLGGLAAGVFTALLAGLIWAGSKGLGFVGGMAGGYAVREAVSTHEDPRAKLERIISDTPQIVEFMGELKEKFPAEYERIVDELIAASTNKSLTEEQVRRAGFEATNSFVVRNKNLILSAPSDVLSAQADIEYEVIAGLENSNQSACAEIAKGGDIARIAWTQNEQLTLAKSATNMVRAMSAARTAQSIRPEPNEEQWADFGLLLSGAGFSDKTLSALATGDLNDLTMAEQCSLGVKVMKLIADLPMDESAFWYAALFREGVAAPK